MPVEVGILEDRKEINQETQLSVSERLMKESLRFQSERSVVWVNLAMIRFMRGDCLKALEYTRKSIETSTRQTDVELARGIVPVLSQALENNQCSNKRAAFRQWFFSR